MMNLNTRSDAVSFLRGFYRHTDLRTAPPALWNVVAALENALAQDSQEAFENYLSAARDAAKDPSCTTSA